MMLEVADLSVKKNKPKSRFQINFWVVKISVITFLLSVFFSSISETLVKKFNLFIAFIVLLIIVLIGIIFDIIGIAVTAASEIPFHAMSSDKVPGARESVKLIRNADIVSNFCNDVVGDIAGIISGAAGAAIILRVVFFYPDISKTVLSVIMSGIVATLTVAGKAIGKGIALTNSHNIVYRAGLFLFFLKRTFGIEILKVNNGKRPRK